jgi:hypothetical protein
MTRVSQMIGAAAFVCAVSAAPPAGAQPIPTEGPAINPSVYKVTAGAKTITVDCDDVKQSLAAALADTSTHDLNIVFSGTCKEYLSLQRDGVAIRGRDATATLAGGLEITAAKRILLEGFTCRDNTQTEYCIGALYGASVTLHNIKVFNAAVRGMAIIGSSAIVDGLTIDKTGSTSILVRGSTVRMEGELTFSNTIEGCLVLDSLAGIFSKIGTFTARDCGIGVLIQSNSTLEAPFATFNLNHNSFAGMMILTHGTFTYGGSLAVKNNTRAGIWVDDASSISPLANIVAGSTVTLENNGEAGVQVTQGSLAELANIKTNTGSEYGILVDDGRLRIRHSKIAGNQKADVRLQFGGRATFGQAAEIGSVTCDGTSQLRGTKASCVADDAKTKPTSDTAREEKK